MEFKFKSVLEKIGKDIARFERKQIVAGALIVKREIKRRAAAVKIKGNLEKGVYHKPVSDAVFVGIHAPGYQNFLVEYGHFQGKPELGVRKWVPPHPVVYPSFEDKADEAMRKMSEVIPL